MHPAEPDDRAYLDDGLHTRLSSELKVLVTESMDGGHRERGEWWWRDRVPAGVVIAPFYARAHVLVEGWERP